ncbi:MAG TPA: phage tail protein [Lachnospiraceae bacterium]|nr:phage tail protein [Lachnospiraceae bacterium]
MTVNEKIKNALAGFGIPVTTDFFGGGEEEYVTFNYADDRAVAFADDAPLLVAADMQIHYFLPADKDCLEAKRGMRKALFRAGFTYPEVTEFVEPDSNVRHIIFECRIENDYELEG